MAFRFRRTMKIAPGVRLNLSKTGVSARVGPRGAGLTVGKSGTTVSAGIPGSGLHTSQKLTAGKSGARNHPPAVPPDQQKLGFFGWIGVFAVVAGLIWVLYAMVG